MNPVLGFQSVFLLISVEISPPVSNFSFIVLKQLANSLYKIYIQPKITNTTIGSCSKVIPQKLNFSSMENCHSYRKERRLQMEGMRVATPVQFTKYSLPINSKAIPIKCFVSHRPVSSDGGWVGRAKKRANT